MFCRQIKKIFLLVFFSLLFPPLISNATPEFTNQTGYSCNRCHVEATGGALTKYGEEFRNEIKTKGISLYLRPFQKVIRLIIRYLHLLAAIAWFGTILYVHILLKPAYAAKGLPKGELILGWVGIFILSITGILLTLSRIQSWQTFYTTRFGILLGFKIILFAIMVTTATIVTFFIGPKLRKQSTKKTRTLSKDISKMTITELATFDGKEGRPAYFGYKGKIYDVSVSSLWKNGSHMKKHLAGQDLTEMIKTAPHEEDKIFKMPEVGELLSIDTKMDKSLYEKVFYFMAYMNLVFVFLITFIIALWRW